MTDGLAERAYADPHRPRFHFVSPVGWLNDPNGLGQWNGRFHLFYQYNPSAPVHHRICWGHASSADLVRWVDEPIALEPGEGPDRDGCWSGVLVDDGGTPTLIYSGHREGVGQRACLAYGDPDLRTWRKESANPVIAGPPRSDVVEFRDHCVWRSGGRWHQLIGSGLRGRGGAALLYDATDLRNWRYVGPILVGDAADRDIWTGTVWECVDLLRMGAGDAPDVLVFSAWGAGVTEHSVYYRGRFDGRDFRPRDRHHLDFGLNYFYAPQSMRDDTGRRLLLGWVQEGLPAEAQREAGWSGVISLPREATLNEAGELTQWPAAEVATLRGAAQLIPAGRLSPGRRLDLQAGDQLDIELALRLSPDGAAAMILREAPDGTERTVLQVAADAAGRAAEVRLDRSESSRDRRGDRRELGGRVRLGPGGRLDLRVLLDHSVIETFANGRPLTARIYPTADDADRVALVALRGEVVLESGGAWTMADIWAGPRPARP